MNQLIKMFLVSDVMNFGDIILQEIENVKNNSKQQAIFSGNIFELTITRQTCVLSNLLDTTMISETIETDRLHQLIKSKIRINQMN